MRIGARPVTALIPAIVLAACQTVPDLQRDAALDALRRDVGAMQASLQDTQATLGTLTEAQAEREADVARSLSRLDRRLTGLPGSVGEACRSAAQPAPAECDDASQVVSTDGRMVLGELEHVWLEPPGINVTARIDSGAESSSVNAQNLVEFERDGADWVRFEWEIDGDTVAIERPVKRHVRIVQQADPEGTRRPVVSLRLRVGATEDDFDFSLADRSHLDHQMNLGRNFLTDLAVVDVARKFVQPKQKTE
ncbi:MAG: RimK/LysX family protein [Pseudomonadota bacterium]